jgi:predicted phage terminase large subunit-like protein
MKATRPMGLMSFIPKLTQRFTEPRHLAPFVELFEAVRAGESVRGVCSVPPRHEKTETTKHAIAWLLLNNPALRICYTTYAATPAEKRGREIRDLYLRAGGTILDDANSKKDWRTGTEDGGLWSTSICGPITGEGFDLLIIDDPVKDRASAESAIEREKIIDWFNDTAFTRLEPDASCIEIGTRWHVSDLGGHLLSSGWPGVILPAIDADGKALCPERYTLAQLLKIKETIGEYGWNSLYQCQPFAKGGALFKDTHFYDALPEGMQIRIGCDFAYSTKSRADYSVAVVLGELAGVVYVIEVLRVQLTAPDFLSRLQVLQAKYGGARAYAYIGGQERGVIDALQKIGPGLAIETWPATADKFTRAQPVSAKWCAGKILLPRSAPWLNAFVSEVVGFTGVGDLHDDQVDALSGGYDAIIKGSSAAAARKRREESDLRLAAGMQLAGYGGDLPPEVAMKLANGLDWESAHMSPVMLAARARQQWIDSGGKARDDADWDRRIGKK